MFLNYFGLDSQATQDCCGESKHYPLVNAKELNDMPVLVRGRDPLRFDSY